jgi:hypothetical protein
MIGLNLSAWNIWLGYRKQIRKPLKPVSIELAQRKLMSFGDEREQLRAVENSIANGWTGLFPPPKEKAVFKAQENAQRQDRDFAEYESRARRVGFRGPMNGEDLLGYKTLVERAEHNHAVSRPKTVGPVPIANLLVSR